MLDGAIDEEVTKPPTCLQVVEWCSNSFRELEGTIFCNSWPNGRFSYFLIENDAKSLSKAPYLVALNMYLTLHLLLLRQSM